MAQKFDISILAGDGIGPEVIAEAKKVLLATDLNFNMIDVVVGSQAFFEGGDTLPREVIPVINESDASLLGALGHGDVPEEFSRKVLSFLRMDKHTFANIRPFKRYSVISAEEKSRDIDVVIVRDNAEGFSLKHSGLIHNQYGMDTRVISEIGAKQIINFAFEYARNQNRLSIACIDQSNWLFSDQMFRKKFVELSKEYPRFNSQSIYVDVGAMMLTRNPDKFDVIVTPGFHGDVLSGILISMTDGIGVAPSANIGKTFGYFEPIHGPAWDVAGKGVANPVASILSAKLMLEWLGAIEEAWLIEEAVSEVLKEGKVRTPDLGGNAGTSRMGDAIVERLEVLKSERALIARRAGQNVVSNALARAR